MKSICIKTNNQQVIDYLLNSIDSVQIENIYYSYLKFKIYKNIIIHYTGNDYNRFISEISHILTCTILESYEEIIYKKIIANEYFYFDSIDRAKILDFIVDLQEDCDYSAKYNLLYNIFNSYFCKNNKLYLDGFITFRLKDYFQLLNDKVDYAVNSFLIDREYTEFISILKIYIKSQKSHADLIHLVYNKSKAILLDENKNIIEDKSLELNAKYLSDISFSANDYAFNTILSLVPKKIYIHLIDEKCDEFINTLKLIFENRVVFCKEQIPLI